MDGDRKRIITRKASRQRANPFLSDRESSYSLHNIGERRPRRVRSALNRNIALLNEVNFTVRRDLAVSFVHA
jgi:hypothetical protein